MLLLLAPPLQAPSTSACAPCTPSPTQTHPPPARHPAQTEEMENMILQQIGNGGFMTEDFEILQQLGRIGTQEVGGEGSPWFWAHLQAAWLCLWCSPVAEVWFTFGTLFQMVEPHALLPPRLHAPPYRRGPATRRGPAPRSSPTSRASCRACPSRAPCPPCSRCAHCSGVACWWGVVFIGQPRARTDEAYLCL